MVLLFGFVCFSSGEKIHEVRKNETLGAIAGKYGVSVGVLQALNGISNPNLLFAGKKLKIPDNRQSQITYHVKQGDSLGIIARRFGVKTSTLASINKILRPDLIKVGQKILVPIKGTKHASAFALLSDSTLKALNSVRPKEKKWKRIVFHHSATPVDDPMNMHRVHKARGMKNGLAYHFVISNGSRKAKDGEVFLSDRWKKQLDGGHMKRQSDNKISIGICLIGNFELRPPTSKQLKSLEGICKYLMRRCNIDADQVTTHKLLHPGHTVCPGKHFPLSSILKKIAS